MPRPGSWPPTHARPIAHHLAAVVAYEDLALYEVGDTLVPVFSVGDQRADPITDEALRERRTCTAGAEVAVPLLAHDRVVGALHVRRSDAPFSAEEVDIRWVNSAPCWIGAT